MNIFKKKRFWILAVYAGLLVYSFVVRMNIVPREPSPGKLFAELQIDGANPVKFGYKEFNPNQAEKLPIVMIHGSPGSAEAFDGLARSLPNRHIITVDLPGFGDSEHDIPDYSIKAHAEYLDSFLKEKRISKAHFVAFSLGGGVISLFTDDHPERVASITFIASIGVQEYELFGEYYTNHIVHGLQLGFAWVLRELTPHFGIFDGGVIEYSRNFYDTDQRPLRTILSRIAVPFLILHGKNDPLVPVEAAREHARIVPQSEYRELDDNHFFVFMRPETISAPLLNFWNKVESGKGIRRVDADASRIRAAEEPFVYTILRAKGPLILCFFLLFFFTALINQDIAFVLAGVFVAQGRFGFLLPVFAIIPAFLFSFWSRFLYARRLIKKDLRKRPPKLATIGRVFGFWSREYYLDGFRENKIRSIFGNRLMGFAVWFPITSIASYLITKGLTAASILNETNTVVFVVICLTLNFVWQNFIPLPRLSRSN